LILNSVVCMFLGNDSFHPGCLTCWCTVTYSS
jgi:hypothetical protein